ncbi:MAG: hypothetical protein IJ326_11605 [Lachnospiraceae bacterium]|nr:hypothetical protein [Lachnospiraceae bacterium]
MSKTEILKEKIADADLVLIGVGEEFNENFSKIGDYPKLVRALEVVEKNPQLSWLVPYLEQMYLAQYENQELLEAYEKLGALVQDKNYFLITTCIDGRIYHAGMNNEKMVSPCGGYRKLQCSAKCCTQLWDADEVMQDIQAWIEEERDLTALQQPVCEHCGKPLVFNNIMAENYVEEGYLEQWEKYTKWLQLTLNKKLCIIELGVGMNMPGIMRWPFEKIAFYNQKASFFRINQALYQLPEDVGEKGISIEGNAKEFLRNL